MTRSAKTPSDRFERLEPEVRTLVDISDSEATRRGRADIVLQRARWAASVYARFNRADVMAIVEAVAGEAHAKAAHYAEWAVRETGFGVAAHKTVKNELTAKSLVDYYRDQDFINARVDTKRKQVLLPRPAGVIFALTPSTNPISTLNYKIIIALMTRNAVVISPHPAARACCVDAAKRLIAVAEAAGAPEGVVQVIDEPSIALVETFMSSAHVNVILATGGTPMVRSAYSSSNPAIGVGPGNAPVFVDATADPRKAAEHIVESKSFDNSVLCTNESVLITLSESERRLAEALKGQGAHMCSGDETEALRRFLFHKRGFNVAALGRSAAWIAAECGIKTSPRTRILVTPITQIGVEEPLAREKLCPVLAFYVAKSREEAIVQARAVLKLSGAGHSAAYHGTDERLAIAYASAVDAYRVVVNAPCSQGAAGFSTHLPPTFTIGTGYFGRSSIGENVGPHHLVHWTALAYNSDTSEPFGDYRDVAQPFEGGLPEAPADGVPGSARRSEPLARNDQIVASITRDELRRVVVEELRSILGSGT